MTTLPVTTICRGPCLHFVGITFFADITTVIKITVPKFQPSTTASTYIYNKLFTLANCIMHHDNFRKIHISCCNQSYCQDKKTLKELCREVEKSWNPNILILAFKLKITKPINDLRNQARGYQQNLS